MEKIIKLIEETTKALQIFYDGNKNTSTAALPSVLPPKESLVDLKNAVNSFLKLWNFFENYEFGQRFDKKLKRRHGGGNKQLRATQRRVKKWVGSPAGQAAIKKVLKDSEEMTKHLRQASYIDPKTLFDPITI